MAASDTKQDIDEMFARMGQKLGWFKNGDRSSDKTMLTNNGKTTTPMKIKEEKPDGKSTDGKKRNRLKLKKKSVKTGSESKEKKNSSKSKFSILKPPSFQGLLSSDSEDEPKVLEINPKSNNQPNAVLCSDSDDDFVEPNRNGNKVNNNGTGSTITCVGESILSSDHSGKSWGKPQSLCDYNDTIVQKRVSIASCTLDIDDLGEPLVESTRIHRRSSITYRQIIEAIQESDNESIESDNDKTNQNRPEADVSDIVCDDTRYVTAIENLEGLKIGPDSPVKTDTETSERYADESDSTNEITRGNEVGQDSDKVDIGNTGSQRNSPSREKSYEDVEVVDCWTQTDDVVGAGSDLNTMTGEVPDVTIANDSETLNVYQEETVANANGKSFDDEDPEVKDLYKEETVDDAVNSQHNESNTYTEDTDVVSDVNIYSGMTENSIKDSEKDGDSIYNEGTRSYNDLHIFAEVTTAGTSDDKQREVYEGNTVYSMDCSDNKPTETLENKNENNTDIENTPELDTSEIEVVDVGTQTEEIVESVNERKDYENITSINEPERDNIDTVEDNNEINDGDSEQSYQTVEEKGEFLDDKAGESSSNENDASDNEISLETEQNDEDIEKTAPLDNGLISSNDDSFDGIAQSKKVQHSRKTKKDKNESKKCSDGGSHKDAEQSWRSRKYSDSSDSDNLESFFQKLRGNPKPIESESESEPHSPVSMDDFIVEDDDMSSESDDNIFYLRETQKMNESPEYVPSCSSSDATDSGSCSNLDDDDSRSESEESRKKVSSKKDKKLLPSFSSGDDEPDNSHNSISDSNTKKSNKKEKPFSPGDKKVKKKSNKLQTSRIDFGLSSDSDSELLDLPEIVVKPSPKVTDKKTKSREDSIPSIGESELFKTPNPIRRKALTSDKENRFKTPTSVKKSSVSSKGYISISEDSDSDSSDFIVTPSPSVRSISDSTAKTIRRTPKTKISGTPKTNTNSTSSLMDRILTPRDIGGNKRADSLSTPLRGSPTCSFLKSLSCSMDDDRRHPEAKKFVKGFKRCKEELSTYLFELFNKTVFDNKLPKDMSLTWNKRLLRTAGYCAYKKNVKNPEDRTARIELSTKVCDSAERTRDTLIHEMCHAAVWLLNGVNGGHGPYWKYWARHATRVHHELPSISRCHSYSINTKFTYRCKKCGYSIGRHSKSLDTKKKVCGYCRGEFELIQNSEPSTPSSASSSVSTTPRQPNKFALFVKEYYNSVKKQKQDLKHGDVMKELSKMFAESKITS